MQCRDAPFSVGSRHPLSVNGRSTLRLAAIGSRVTYSVQDWDGGIRLVMIIDENAGWLEGAQESVLDPKRHAVGLSVHLFRNSKGARSDFGQFFTNSQPETVYLAGESWSAGTAVSGLGHRATIYHVEDAKWSRPPTSAVSG
jgi:hypothetical protein